MKEHPILFSGPMVRAILDGRKTQTRRVFKVTDPMGERHAVTSPAEEILRFDDGSFHYLSTGALSGPYPCPYGAPGDRLWVRETWQYFDDSPIGQDAKFVSRDRLGPAAPWMGVQGLRPITWRVAYRADGELHHPIFGPAIWRPSIHMPRWASRITLEVVGVRVERLQEISEADAEAEGGAPFVTDTKKCSSEAVKRRLLDEYPQGFRANFALLWDSINAKRGFGWDANPFVWVVEFKRVRDLPA